MTPRSTRSPSWLFALALVVGCATRRAPTSLPPTVDVSPAVDAPSAAPPNDTPTFTLGDQASGARAYARGVAGHVVLGAVAFPGVDGALLVVAERADVGVAERRVFVVLPGDSDAGAAPSVLLAGAPVEIAVTTLDPARGPVLLVRYEDPQVLPSVGVFPLHSTAPWVDEPNRDIAWLDGVPCLTHADARAPAPGNLGPAAVAGRTPLAGVAALAAGPDAPLAHMLAADLVWCTGHQGNTAPPTRCRPVPLAQRNARWIATTLRPALRSLVASDLHDQGADYAEGATGNDHRVRVQFVGAGLGRRINRIEVTTIDLGE